MASHISVIPPETPSQINDEIDWKNVVGGIAVLGALIAGLFALLPLVCRSASDLPKYSFVVFYPGNADVDEKTPVFLHRVRIGTVREFQPALTGLQVRISEPGLFDRAQVATLLPPDSVIFDHGNSVLVLQSPTQAFLRHARATFVLRRNAEGKWVLTPGERSGSLIVNNRLAVLGRNGNVDSLLVGNGDVLGFGLMKLEWQDIESFTRIRAELDSSDVIGAGGLPDSSREAFSQLTGYGSEVRIATLFGLSRPSMQLYPSYSTVSLIENRSGLKEFTPQAGTDLQALLDNAGAYLFSRSKLDAAPANRYELAVADINTFIHNIASLSAKDEGRGMLSRLLLERGALAQLEGIVNDLRRATSAGRAALEQDSGKGLATRLLFRDEEAVRKINDLPGQVDSVLLRGIPEMLIRLNLTLLRAEEVLNDLQRTSAEGRRQVRSLGDNPGQIFRSPKK